VGTSASPSIRGVGFIHQLAGSHYQQRCTCCRIRTSTGERTHSKPAEGRSRIFGGRLAGQTDGAQNAAAGTEPLLRRFGSRRYGIYESQSTASSCAPLVECPWQPVDRSGVRDKAELGTVSLGFTVTSTQIRSGFAIYNTVFSHPTACPIH
jgi:hypothetical protein